MPTTMQMKVQNKAAATSGGRSKQELLELRKEMMKSKVKSKVDNFQQQPLMTTEGEKSADTLAVPTELMHRLA